MKIIVKCVLILLLISSLSVAEEETNKVKGVIKKTIDIKKEELKKNKKWEGEEAALIDQLTGLRERSKILETRKKKALELLSDREEKLKEQKRILKESVILAENIYGFLNDQYKRLESFIQKDIPFLSSERDKRLKMLKDILKNPDIKNSEKFRRVAEAVRIETEYGNGVEVYRENISLGEKKMLVDLLRVGRVCLFFSGLDSKECGFYNPRNKKFEYLPEKYSDEIRNTIEISKGRRVPSIVKLPVGRIKIQ